MPGILDGAEATEWVGMRPMTPDGLAGMIAGDGSVPDSFDAAAFDPGRF